MSECQTEEHKAQCIKLDTCPKIVMVRDKDLAGDWQYAEAIRSVCNKCDEWEGGDQ